MRCRHTITLEVAALGLLLAGCSAQEGQPAGSSSSDQAEPVDQIVSEIPTEEEADAAAESLISDENASDQLELLTNEIESDPDGS